MNNNEKKLIRALERFSLSWKQTPSISLHPKPSPSSGAKQSTTLSQKDCHVRLRLPRSDDKVTILEIPDHAILKNALNVVFLCISILLLSGCGASERLKKVGMAPEMSPIENPQTQSNYRPISLPMPEQKVSKRQPNSLWDGSRQTFFKDQRASNIGDIITVKVSIADQAELDNKSSRSRNSGENAGLSNFLGLEKSLNVILPEAVDNENLMGMEADSSHAGEGSIEREETIDLKLAAIITQVLPNGNLVIHGKQEVRVNYEKRILQLDGVIRPEDIDTDNSISSDKIAEARVVYGGEGQINDMQQPRYGQQIYDIIFPF